MTDQTARAPVHVQVRGLSHQFDLSRGLLDKIMSRGEGRLLRAVDDVSFDIRRGETFALVGESGSGKSTLARILSGLLAARAGEILIDGHKVSATGPRPEALRTAIQMVFQDPYASLNPRWRVDRLIAEPIRALPAAERDRRVDDLLRLVGLDPLDKMKYPHQFSGGQRQRVAIARSLAANAPFLVCDEPTSALDVSVQAQILNLMRRLQDQFGLTYLFISHNLAVVRYMATEVGVMYLGRLVEVAPADRIFAAPRHPYTRMLLEAVPGTGLPRAEVRGEVPSPISPPPGCTFHPRCPLAEDICRREVPAFRDGVACHVAHRALTGAAADQSSA
jgi:peptide/nickel transport system ATP-binding protein